MQIRITTDSAADIPRKFYEQYNIAQIPHNVIFEDGIYKVGKDISVKQYYEKLAKAKKLPSSATPDIGDYERVFRETLEDLGYEHIIHISVSKELTSTYNAVRILAKRFPNQITLINAESASGVQGLLVLTAAKLAAKEENLKSILNILEEKKKNSILTVGFWTLENVYKSGRLKSEFLLKLTKWIKIKPVASMEKPGILKSRIPGFFTTKSMEKRVTKIALSKTVPRLKYDVMISHLNNQTGANRIIKIIRNRLATENIFQSECSPIIGTNTGEGTIILSLLPTTTSIIEYKED